MTWIRVTGVPNEDNLDEPRMHMLVNLEFVAGFGEGGPKGHTQIYGDWDPTTPVMCIAESLEEIQDAIAVAEAVAARLQRPVHGTPVGMSIG